MKVNRRILVAGVVLMVALSSAALAWRSSASVPPGAPSAQPTMTAVPTATATAESAATPAPTATPTPFAGKVGRLKLPRFGVDAPIEELSVDATNTMETPRDENTDVGWYNSELKPGAPFLGTRPGWDGNAVFSAHVYYRNIPGPFQKLAQSNVGDEVIVAMEDGAAYHYRVISNRRYDRDTIPMGEIISPPDRPAGKQWITMITCGGELDSTGQQYLSRDVVVAERIS